MENRLCQLTFTAGRYQSANDGSVTLKKEVMTHEGAERKSFVCRSNVVFVVILHVVLVFVHTFFQQDQGVKPKTL